MGVLGTARLAVVICTRDRASSVRFYRDVLGLAFAREDELAAVFEADGVQVRVSAVPDFRPHGHTILGFRVADVGAAVEALAAQGVTFKRFAHLSQDERGVLALAGGEIEVAWLEDPDGNLLSVTNA